MSASSAVSEAAISFEERKREYDRRSPTRLILQLFDLSGMSCAEAARQLELQVNMFTQRLNFANDRKGQQTSLAFGTATRLLDLIRPKLKPEIVLTKVQVQALLFKLMEADESCRVAMKRLRAGLRFNVDNEYTKIQAAVDMRSGKLSKKHEIKDPAVLAVVGGAKLRIVKGREEIAAEIVEERRRAGAPELDQSELAAAVDREENRRDDQVERYEEEARSQGLM
jgi:hypothetical protein